MRSRSVSDWLAAVAFTAAALAATPARADQKQVCSAAYDATQALRRDGRLQEAREQAAVCTADACAEFIRTDCAKWLGEIDASQPSVVFEVKDAKGRETAGVKVSLDGKPWLPSLDGKAKLIDPGSHTLRYEMAGSPPVEATIQIREGEKNRRIAASFEASGAAPAPDAAAPASPTGADTAPKRSIAPWVIGGVGVAGLAVGAITGLVVMSARSDFDKHCKGTPLRCDSQGQSDASTVQSLGPVSTIGFVVGGLGVATAAVWLVTTRKSGNAAPSAALGASMTADGGRLRLEGTW